ncbi:hypothetical protein VTI74DRAFT_7875 [Chaetomium olivicolor]
MALEDTLMERYPGDFLPGTNEQTKIRFQQLNLEMKFTGLKVSVQTLGNKLRTVNIPPSSPLNVGGIVDKEKKRGTRFLLTSLIWKCLTDGFFSSPFGQGPLGAEDGKKQLVNLFMAYRNVIGHEVLSEGPYYTSRFLQADDFLNTATLLRTGLSSGDTGVVVLSRPSIAPTTRIHHGAHTPLNQLTCLFQTDATANSWRAATFRALLHNSHSPPPPRSYSPPESENDSAPGTPSPSKFLPLLTTAIDAVTKKLTTPYRRNINAVFNDICSVLDRATGNTGVIPDDVGETVAKLVNNAGQFALELATEKEEYSVEEGL